MRHHHLPCHPPLPLLLMPPCVNELHQKGQGRVRQLAGQVQRRRDSLSLHAQVEDHVPARSVMTMAGNRIATELAKLFDALNNGRRTSSFARHQMPAARTPGCVRRRHAVQWPPEVAPRRTTMCEQQSWRDPLRAAWWLEVPLR
mmetsp:Transcript_94304/g.177444  ORF Transcript_94304/g.177444 Transcript_94304/m.177444 type:complete len:144 (-) Transcript_94304:101-532(-)